MVDHTGVPRTGTRDARTALSVTSVVKSKTAAGDFDEGTDKINSGV